MAVKRRSILESDACNKVKGIANFLLSLTTTVMDSEMV